MKIPFSKITFGEEEEQAIIDCMRSGWVVLGPKTKEFEEAFAQYVGATYAVFVDSGTSALMLALQAKRDYYKDFVNIPSLTFCSDAEIVYHAGLKIKFADINKDTFCVDEDYDNLLPVNFSGNRAKGYGAVIDSCHRIEKDDVRGSDSLWIYSFYGTKNISCVHGGMIALNDESTYKWLMLARDHGLTKSTEARYKGNNPFYDVIFPGWRVKGNDLMASIGLSQLKKLPWITEQRNRVVARYNKNLGLNNTGNHLYIVQVNERAKLISTLFDQGVQTSIHFLPIHKFTAYKDENANLPVTDSISERIVSLPLFPQMTDEEVDYVCDKLINTKLLVK
jgi:perosamine synthetase